ncbi:MAG: hypothetical protein IKM08_04160 [Clostridia bacterium]|nr:hypothetical protein [Clostridia bacterium]
MPELKEKRELTEEYFFGEIYKSVKMGADMIINLLPSVKDDRLRSTMTLQLDGYEKYAARAALQLEERGLAAKEENLFARLTSKVGTAINAMIDSGAGHIAEMMIGGSNMTITDMTRLQNLHLQKGTAPDAVRLASEVITFEEHNLDMLKRYL